MFVVDKIRVRPNSVRKELLRQGYLDGVKLNTITGASVSILIGADFPQMLTPMMVIISYRCFRNTKN